MFNFTNDAEKAHLFIQLKGDYDVPKIDVNSLDYSRVINLIGDYILDLKSKVKLKLTTESNEFAKEQYDVLFDNVFSYEFTEGDLKKVQTLINELRDEIAISELFTAEHKQRLLNKLEKMQSELHKKVSDLDRFWGLIGEAGIVIGKFGNDAKPIVDRIRELADIAWRTQASSEQLPSGSTIPFLTAADK